MRRFRIVIIALLTVIGTESYSGAQTPGPTLSFSILERYLDSFREQTGIPGLSAAVIQNGALVWDHGFGNQDIEANIPARADTPYFIADVSQTFGSTLLLRKCLEENTLELGDRVTRWVPTYPEPETTIGQLLTHTAPSGQFAFNGERFAALTPVIEECADIPYPEILAGDIFERFGMTSSVPGRALGSPSEIDQQIFPAATLARYADVLRRLAQPYRLDQGRPVRTQAPAMTATAANGIVTTVRDFFLFDSALRSGVLLNPSSLVLAWTQASSGGTTLPTGLGWFVQNYNGEPLIWHLGLTKDAYSSLVLKLPRRDVTLVLMANSDGLGSQAALDSGDITTSTFARLLLRLLVP